MTAAPFFTIVVPCFNSAATLCETIASVVNQTDTDWEMIIVDDGSTDASLRLAVTISSSCEGIHILPTKNRGVSAARNAGAATARGTVIAFLDADDSWQPDTLALHRSRFEAELDLMVSYARVAFADANLQPLGRVSAKPPVKLQPAHVLGENPVCTGSNIFVRRSAFQRIGGFDEQLRHAEDQEWMFRALVKCDGRIAGLDHVLVNYRANPAGAHGDLIAMEQGWETMLTHAAVAAPTQVAAHRSRAKARHLRLLARRALRNPAQAAQALPLMGRALALYPALIASRRSLQTLAAALAITIISTPTARGRLTRLFG